MSNLLHQSRRSSSCQWMSCLYRHNPLLHMQMHNRQNSYKQSKSHRMSNKLQKKWYHVIISYKARAAPQASNRFFNILFWIFFRWTHPAHSMANPACMKNTRHVAHNKKKVSMLCSLDSPTHWSMYSIRSIGDVDSFCSPLQTSYTDRNVFGFRELVMF